MLQLPWLQGVDSPSGQWGSAMGWFPESWSSYWYWAPIILLIGVVSWFLFPAQKQCPICGKWVYRDARICPFCGHGF